MSLHFKRLGVLVLSLFGLVSFFNITNAETFVITGNFESYNNDNTRFDPISFNASFYNSSNTLPTIDCIIINPNCIYYGEKSSDGSSIDISTDCTTSNFEINTQLLSNIYMQGNNIGLPGFYSDLINDGFNFNYPTQYIPAFGQMFQLDYYYPFTIEILSLSDKSNCEDIFGYACNFTDMQILGSYECVISGNVINNFILSNNSCPSCPTCPDQYSSLECQQEYSLIPISSVDSNYCTTNGFCPSFGGSDCGSGDVSWSALYINDIQHLGKPVISIDIPEEIEWDYTSTDSEFNVDVVGYNVDYDYINGIVDIQNYSPTREDLTAVISSMGPFVSLLVGALFIILMFYFIKKIFK